jgi:hypothetical protein
MQRIEAQQAERYASSQYAARMELEAQTQAESGLQAEARDDVELELLCRSLNARVSENRSIINTPDQRPPTSERPVAATPSTTVLQRHWPFGCCSSPMTGGADDGLHVLLGEVVRNPGVEAGAAVGRE